MPLIGTCQQTLPIDTDSTNNYNTQVLMNIFYNKIIYDIISYICNIMTTLDNPVWLLFLEVYIVADYQVFTV